MATSIVGSEAAQGRSGQYVGIDSDGHIQETLPEIFPYLEEPYGSDMQLKRRMNQWLPKGDGWNRIAMRIEDAQARGIKRRDNNRPDWPQWQDWVEFLDQTDITATVLYPSDMLSFGGVRGAPWARTLARAYNNYFYDQFARHSDRLHGMALIPMVDGNDAAAELERGVRELRMAGGMLAVTNLKRQLGDRSFDPLYAMAQELDVPLGIHAGGTEYLGFDR